MSKKKKTRYFVCDFETTVYEGQERTDVWASAVTEMFSDSEHVEIHHSLPETYDYLLSLNTDMVCYYHNLKFDGCFWLDFILKTLKFEPAIELINPPNTETTDAPKPAWIKTTMMKNNTYKCSISSMGQWYTITLKVNNRIIELRDSLKLLPFAVEKIGKSFKTKHKKLSMVYEGFRYPGCEITDEEKHYIANDVLVVREALEFMFSEGHDKLTIGACCLSEYVNIMYKDEYNAYFPNVYDIEIDKDTFGAPNVGEYVRKSYRGGWCYVVKGKENRKFTNGTTADVNSLYPSVMSSESGNYYPIGRPTMVSCKNWKARQEEYISFFNKAKANKKYYIIRIKTRFYIKQGKLPFIQIKNSFRFRGNECLETTDYYNRLDGKYYTHYWFGPTKEEQTLHDTRVELTLTVTDFILFLEHYDVVDFEILDYCEFASEIGLFDSYIDKYKELKLVSVGAMRELAKLFLNNLYGKMASSTDSSFKLPFLKEDGSVGLQDVKENGKKPGYIPVGSAITSYARNFTIRAAQQNYHGVDKRGFIYADTDSIHCDLEPNEITGITVHDKNFCCWKLESCWDVGYFSRQKTYIEHVTHEDGVAVEQLLDDKGNPRKPYYNIKCAGMPKKCKSLFEKSLENYEPTEEDNFTPEELAVINAKYNIDDFKIGLTIPGKLLPKRIPGGVLLVETTYEMR